MVGPCGPPSVAVSVWLVILVAASTGRRRGRPPWWRPSVWLAGVLAGGPCRLRPSAVLAVGPCGWCPSVAVVAVFVAAGGLSAVRWSTGPPWSFRGPWRPFFGPCQWWAVAALAGWCTCRFQLVVFRRRLWPVAAGVRCWSLRALLRRRWSRWPCRWPSLLNCWCRCRCAVPWPVVRVAGRQYWPPCGGVLVGVVAPSRGGPCAVSVRPCWCPPWRSLAVSVRPCWCAGVRSVAGVRFLPFSVAVAALSGRRWCWCPSLVLAARTGRFWALLAGWPCGPCQWLAAVAGGACACGGACLVKERRPVAGWRWAVCGAFRGGGVRLPCLWSLLVSRQRRPWAVRLSKDQTPAAAVAALLVVCVTCLRWRRWRRRRWLYPCASRTTYGGRRSVCRRRYILKRRRTGWRWRRRSAAFRPCQWLAYGLLL